jgi:hypothetical protein
VFVCAVVHQPVSVSLSLFRVVFVRKFQNVNLFHFDCNPQVRTVRTRLGPDQDTQDRRILCLDAGGHPRAQVYVAPASPLLPPPTPPHPSPFVCASSCLNEGNERFASYVSQTIPP